MLNEIFINKIVRDAISKYESENGRTGISKKDVIELTMQCGGDANDVHAVMAEAVRRFVPEHSQSRFF